MKKWKKYMKKFPETAKILICLRQMVKNLICLLVSYEEPYLPTTDGPEVSVHSSLDLPSRDDQKNDAYLTPRDREVINPYLTPR